MEVRTLQLCLFNVNASTGVGSTLRAAEHCSGPVLVGEVGRPLQRGLGKFVDFVDAFLHAQSNEYLKIF